jgi:preprotein translocase subunit SecF
MIKKVMLSVFIFLIGIGFLFYNELVLKNDFEGTITVTVVYEDYSDTREIKFKEDDNLLLLLEDNFIIEYKHYLGIGNMITRIDDLIQVQDTYIIIFIDGEFATTGVDYISLIDGMTIKFELW